MSKEMLIAEASALPGAPLAEEPAWQQLMDSSARVCLWAACGLSLPGCEGETAWALTGIEQESGGLGHKGSKKSVSVWVQGGTPGGFCAPVLFHPCLGGGLCFPGCLGLCGALWEIWPQSFPASVQGARVTDGSEPARSP